MGGVGGGGTSSILVTILAIFGLSTKFPAANASRRLSDYYHNALSNEPSVRWQTDPFSPCSAPCGGGVQHRLIRCVKEDVWSHGQVIEVPVALCPPPMPDISQACNSHRCIGRWQRGTWSSCSVTCGVGTQKRDVKCVSSLWQGQAFQMSRVDCGGKSPPEVRKCHIRDCPFPDRLHQEKILAENYTLIQLRKARKLKVVIGGDVKLLPGQTIVVKCPVRHFSRRLVYWSKGYKLVPFTGRVRVTNGGLRIQKADPAKDGGLYTCIAGDVTADIKVEFTSKNDPSSETYRSWARKSRRRYRRRYPNRYSQERVKKKKDVIVTSPYINDGRQRDQGGTGTTNRTQALSYVGGDWTACSVTCGSEGTRRRKLYCSHVTSKYVKMVPEELCAAQGLQRPHTVEPCGATECPVWKPGPWSSCHPSCGKVGHKSRVLVCLWEKSGSPAWNNCDASKKPTTRKPCKLAPCPKECLDKSRRCPLASQLRMCRFKQFREDCCFSCTHPNEAYSRYSYKRNKQYMRRRAKNNVTFR